jgi:isopenicillin N synthase-like dioxygenase
MTSIPIIDISCLRRESWDELVVLQMAEHLAEACTTHGFFYVSGHGVSVHVISELERVSHQFFAQAEEEKMKISMSKGGIAWRGYFPVEGELTSGKPDLKEGIYFGTELGLEDIRVQANTPMHGPNLFPENSNELKDVVLNYMNAVTQVGHLVMKAIALSLGLDADYFHARYTQNPLILFRIFHYPPQPIGAVQWGVGEHTDYGLLTLLLQDSVGGLQVKSGGIWVDAPPIPNTFVCNIGDMLDRMTGGLYRSTPHRVLNASGKQRLSFPLFFDPAFDSRVELIAGITPVEDDRNNRWDKASVHDFEGTYGAYLLRKVGAVFPELRKDVL